MNFARACIAPVLVLAVLAAVVSPARAEDAPVGPVVVASKPDVEGRILGHVVAEALKDAEIDVEERMGFGDTVDLRMNIKMDEVDIYPEYVGLGKLMYPTIDPEVWLSSENAFQTLKETDHVKNGLIWLKAALADAGWRIVCRRDFALEYGLKTMEDFAAYVSDGGGVKLACCGAFTDRDDVLPAFQRAYKFMLEPENFEPLETCDTAEAQRMLAEGRRGVNFSMAFGTDPAIKEFDLVLLKDVKNSQITYQPSPVAREEIVNALPQLKQILTPIFGALTTSTMQSLNAAVVYDGMTPKQAAGAYLESHGFIK
jgi:osmoprotectant transport system substrate-binding protein